MGIHRIRGRSIGRSRGNAGVCMSEELESIYSDIALDPAFEHLRKTGAHFVPGAGNRDRPALMFIGEAPGAQEDRKGIPFVGAAGKILDNLLEEIGLDREKIFISNVLKYRPPANRDPVPDERKASAPYLLREIESVRPRLVVLLGRHALTTFFPTQRISAVHGQMLEERFVVLYHPATVIYDPGRRAVLTADFRKLVDFLDASEAWPNS
jgi:uracil-DNA glycosylase family 4